MGQVPLLDELAVIAVIAVAVIVVLSRLRLPAVAGLLAAGAILGPFGLGLAHSVHAIEVLAEVGVVLLLFTIGLEFSLAHLKDILGQVAVGGALQVGVTVAVTAGIAYAFGQPPGPSLFYGFVFSLSSTAIVLRALTERQELDAPHGRFIVGTLIFQDLCVVPMVLVVPLMGTGPRSSSVAVDIGFALAKAVLVVVAIIGLSRFVVPRILGWVDASRSREVFLLAILAICTGTAWTTSLAGLSLALGAFLGGMVVADTEYGHRAMGDMLPLRDAFVSIFFISLGMLFDVRELLDKPFLVGALLLGFVGVKAILATGAAFAMRFPPRVAWLAGVGLAQFGEFGFVLAKLGQSTGVVSAESMRPLLAAGVMSMFLTPLLVRVAPHITAGERLLAPLERLLGVRSFSESEEADRPRSGHVVIVGFGLAGRLAASALSSCGIDHVIFELNAGTVRAARQRGMSIYYGDATSEEALKHASLGSARAMVLLINDPGAAQRVIATASRVAPHTPILTRSRYFGQRDPLIALGARDVVAEEVEGAVEIIARLLRWSEVPRNLIDDCIRDARLDTQTTDRKFTLPRPTLADHRGLDELKIDSVLILAQSAGLNSTPVSLRLRSRTGALVVAVRRGDSLLSQPDPNVPFEVGDVVYLVGTSQAIRAATVCLGPPAAGIATEESVVVSS